MSKNNNQNQNNSENKQKETKEENKVTMDNTLLDKMTDKEKSELLARMIKENPELAGNLLKENEGKKNESEDEGKTMGGKIKLGFYEKLSEEVKYMMTPEGIIEYGCEKQKELPKEKLERESEIIKEKVKEYLKAFDELDDAIQEIESTKDTERYYVLLKELDEKMMNDEHILHDVKRIYESTYTNRFLSYLDTHNTYYDNYEKNALKEVNEFCKRIINGLRSLCELKIGITNLYEASGLDVCDDNEENSNDEDIKIFLKGLTIRYPHILFEFEI